MRPDLPILATTPHPVIDSATMRGVTPTGYASYASDDPDPDWHDPIWCPIIGTNWTLRPEHQPNAPDVYVPDEDPAVLCGPNGHPIVIIDHREFPPGFAVPTGAPP